MANTLNLIPARVPIGRATDQAGKSLDVLQTPEFARALADLLARVGGANGISITEITKELASRTSVIEQSATPVKATGITTPVVLASITVPGGAMGRNGMLRITTTWSVTNSANNKTVIIRFGGSDISSNAVTTASTYQEQRQIQNRNSQSSQIFVFGGAGFTGAPIATLEKNTSESQTIDIVAQLSKADESMTLEAYTVELIPSP